MDLFILAFKRYFSDCASAEQFVHETLEQKGCRIASNKEFFRAALDEVIDVVLCTPGHSTAEDAVENPLEQPDEIRAPDPFLDSRQVTDPPPWQALFEEAEAHYYRFDTYIQDYSEAMRLYKQAARLGCNAAYLRLGIMNLEGEGCSANRARALEYLKDGCRHGELRCYAEMANIFASDGQFDNAKKCWDRYFTGPPTEEDLGRYGFDYFKYCYDHKWPLVHREKLRLFIDAVRQWANRMIVFCESKEHTQLLPVYKKIQEAINREFGAG